MSDIKAIETQYRGYRFRSRLEARYAVFFDVLGVKWEYEKEGYVVNGQPYLPDFWLPKQRQWVEIKPSEGYDRPGTDDLLMSFADQQPGTPVMLCEGGPAGARISRYQFSDGGASLGTDASVFDLVAGDSITMDSYIDACVAANSARFEYGESGAPSGASFERFPRRRQPTSLREAEEAIRRTLGRTKQ